MTLGWTRYSAEYGSMEPHHHAEETIIVTAAKDAYMRFGPEKDQLCSSASGFITGQILPVDSGWTVE